MPWMNFEKGAFGPYTRAFVGLVKVTPAGEKIILPKDRYGRSGGLVISNVALYEVNPPALTATLAETFPTYTVNGWALQQDSLCAVMLAQHMDGGEFWGGVLNLNTMQICFPLALTGGETMGKLADMFLPKLGIGKLTKNLGGASEKQWREDLDHYSEPASGAVLGFVERAMQSNQQSGRL